MYCLTRLQISSSCNVLHSYLFVTAITFCFSWGSFCPQLLAFCPNLHHLHLLYLQHLIYRCWGPDSITTLWICLPLSPGPQPLWSAWALFSTRHVPLNQDCCGRVCTVVQTVPTCEGVAELAVRISSDHSWFKQFVLSSCTSLFTEFYMVTFHMITCIYLSVWDAPVGEMLGLVLACNSSRLPPSTEVLLWKWVIRWCLDCTSPCTCIRSCAELSRFDMAAL